MVKFLLLSLHHGTYRWNTVIVDAFNRAFNGQSDDNVRHYLFFAVDPVE